MTEQEIIAYLKASTTCYDFWPEEVKEWADKRRHVDIWQVYCGGKWHNIEVTTLFVAGLPDEEICRLCPNYEPEKEVKYEYKELADFNTSSISCIADVSVDGKLYIKVKKH